jgi:PIF1-like helicase
LLKDIIGNLHLFGGLSVSLGGDSRQTLAVVRGGSHRESLQASITTCTLWYEFNIYRFTVSMRTKDRQQDFADWLLGVGNGTLNKANMDVTINLQRPKALSTIDSHITNVFSLSTFPSTNENNNKAILRHQNKYSRQINDIVSERLNENLITFRTAHAL